MKFEWNGVERDLSTINLNSKAKWSIRGHFPPKLRLITVKIGPREVFKLI